MGTWWPFETHSIHGEKVETVVFEGREGGSVHEVATGGETAPWATVLAWEPPTRVLLSWHVNPENPATEIEVRFAPEGDGTRVDLEHRGFERLGEHAEAGSGAYDEGWDLVLGRFVDGAAE